jgi:hypothetical protein
MITELLTTLKSDILQEIAKGIAGTVPNIHFTHQGVPNRPSAYQGVHNIPSTHQTVPNSPLEHQGDPNSPLEQNELFDFPSIEIGVVLQYSDFQTQIEYQIEKEEEANRRRKLARANKKGKQQPVHKQPVRKVRR